MRPNIRYNRPQTVQGLQRIIAASIVDRNGYSRDDFLTHLRQFFKLQAWADLVSHYRTYAAECGSIKPYAFNLYIQALSKLGDNKIDVLRADFQRNPFRSMYDTITANTFCANLVKREQITKALSLVESLQEREFILDVTTYNILLNAAKKGSVRIDLLSSVIAQMTRANIECDTVSYNTIIAAYAGANDSENVAKYFRLARDLGKVDTQTFNTVISHEMSSHNWAGAWSLLLIMRQLSIPRDQFTYQPFLNSIAQSSDFSQAPGILNLMRQDDVSLELSTANAVLRILFQQGAINHAVTMIRYLHSHNIAPDKHTMFVLQSYKDMIKNSPGATDVLQAWLFSTGRPVSGVLQRSLNLTLPPSTVQLDLLASQSQRISNLLRNGRLDSAILEYHKIFDRGIRPSMKLFMQLLTASIRAGDFRRAGELIAGMDPIQLSKNLRFQTTIILIPNTTAHFERTINVLRKFNVSLDIPFFTAAAWRLYKDHRFHDAIGLLKHAISLGLVLDLIAYVTLLECLAKTRDLAGVVWCLREMKSNKVMIDMQAKKRMTRIMKHVAPLDADLGQEGHALVQDLKARRTERLAKRVEVVVEEEEEEKMVAMMR